MNIQKLVQSAQFLVDTEGNKKAVQLDFNLWQELLQLLTRLTELKVPRLTQATARIAEEQEVTLNELLDGLEEVKQELYQERYDSEAISNRAAAIS